MVRRIVIVEADGEPKKRINDVYTLDEAIEETSNNFLEISLLNKSDLKCFFLFLIFFKCL